MSRIFISHSHADQDNEETRELQRWLTAEGFESHFLDFDPARGLAASKRWEDELLRKLLFCRVFLAVVSENWLASRWCFAEYSHARLRGRPIFLIKIDASPLPPELSTRQHVDLTDDREHALAVLHHGLRQVDTDPRRSYEIVPERPVYPGMLPFEEEDAAVYFGRDIAVDDCVAHLDTLSRTGGSLLIFGPSGSGKSSLMRAGILPIIRRQPRRWVVFPTFRPRGDGLAAFARALGLPPPRIGRAGDDAHDGSQDEVARDIAATFSEKLDSWRATHTSGEVPILVPIDQLEECFGAQQQLTVSVHRSPPMSGHARVFVRVLVHLLKARSDLAIMMTIRSDSLAVLQAHRGDDENLPYQRLFHPLNPMRRSDLFKVIAGPAQHAEIELEPGLVGRIVDDVKSGEALPLLAFTLRQLHVKSSDPHRLTIADYQHLGGVSGAVETHANGLLAQVGRSTLDDVRAAFLSMVQLDESGVPLKQQTPWARLAEPVRRLLQQFVEVRLLVRKEETIEIAHEALFEHWPMLRRWIDEAKDALHTVRHVESAARAWESRERPTRLEWSDERVVEAILAYRALRGTPADDPPAREFLAPFTREEMAAWLEEQTTTHETRASIGDRLALLGDDRTGVGWRDHIPDLVWCDVPAGLVCIQQRQAEGDRVSDTREENWLSRPEPRDLPEHGAELEVQGGVQVTKYPITWTQFRRFVEADDGLRHPRWWPDDHLILSGLPSQPRVMDNRPASGVSWFMAVAFTRWVSERLGYPVRLPTEWEWQQAATGGDTDRTYTWGRTWDAARTNTWESGLRRTTAVGMYPQATSPVGAMDMAGNAWEWCLNQYRDPGAPFDWNSRETRVVKGGSCIVDGKKNARTDYAGKLDPTARYVTSFRLVRTVSHP